MSKLEQHSGHSATSTGKAGGCCGAHDNECDGREPASAGQDQKPAVAGHGSHAQAGDAGGSCGCGGKHK